MKCQAIRSISVLGFLDYHVSDKFWMREGICDLLVTHLKKTGYSESAGYS